MLNKGHWTYFDFVKQKVIKIQSSTDPHSDQSMIGVRLASSLGHRERERLTSIHPVPLQNPPSTGLLIGMVTASV